LDKSILKSDHRVLFLDLNLLLLFGVSLERLERPQFRNLKLDDPWISYSYRKLLHKQLECHNIYDRVQTISERGNADDMLNEDEHCYEILDRDITAAMLRAAEKCTIRSQHDTPWAPSLSKATHTIRYRARRISRNGIRHTDDKVLDHFLEHGFGVSDKTYGSTTKKLLYGIGQGSCASPILWALINQLLLSALGEKFTYIRLVAIDGEEEHIRPGDSFVDDTTTGYTKDDPKLEPVSHDISELTTSEEIGIAKMEEIIRFFLDSLQVTGGDLAPEKCVWYLISHCWKDGNPRLLQKHSSHCGFKIVSRSTNTASGVRRKAPNEGHGTLGSGILYDRRRCMHCP
jgi:hypothetical protein